MNKIIKAALTAKFQDADTENTASVGMPLILANPYMGMMMDSMDMMSDLRPRLPKHLRKFKSKPFSEKTLKIARNSPCPCGCGKKAKKCTTV